MATFKTLPAGVMRGDPRDVYPLLDKDNLPVGFTSSQGDTFMATYATDPLTGGVAGLASPYGGTLGLSFSTEPLIEVKTWVGNGTTLSIETTFKPDAVIIIADSKYPVFAHRFTWRKRTPYMGLANPHIVSGGVSFSPLGFSVDSDGSLNASGVTYKAIVLADNGSGKVVCGSYSGNGVGGREIDNVGGQPVFVMVKRDNSFTSQLRFESSAQGLQGFNVTPTDNITGFTANGFTVSAAADINAAVTAAGSGGEAYDFIALLPSSKWKCFSYAASGATGQKVYLPWTPCAALVKSTDAASPQFMAAMIDGQTKNVSNGALVSDGVTAASTGLTLGTNAIVNASGKVYNGIAFTANSQASTFVSNITQPGLLVNSAVSSGVVCATANASFDRAAAAFSLEWYGEVDQTQAADMYLFTRSLNSSNISYGLYWNASNLQYEFVGHEAAANKALFSTATQLTGAQHIILTFDGTSKFRFAVNGETVKVMDTAFLIDASATSLMTFGCRNNSGAPATTGCAANAKMYLARFYTSALTDAQILSRYKRAALADSSVADVSYFEEWDFSRLVGSTVYASKNAANNGTVTNCTAI